MTDSRNMAAEFKRLPKMEILLGAGALAVLLGFIFANLWSYLFKFTWFPTLAFIGAIAALTLVILRVAGVEFMPAKSRAWLLLGVALLPALGILIDELRHFWGALMLAGALVMAYAAAPSKAAAELTHRVTEPHAAKAPAPAPRPAPAPEPPPVSPPPTEAPPAE